MSESVTIKGEIEGWGRETNKFRGGRGSLGMKVDGEWHNLIGKIDDLEKAQKDFPKGTIVQFAEIENKRGYLDIVEDSLKKIEKSEAYKETKGVRPQSEDRKEKDFVSCFMSATSFIKTKVEDSLRRAKPMSAFQISNETMQMANQLYLDFQKTKENLKKEGKW